MVAGKLYTYPGSFRAAKILVAAEFSGAKIEVVSQPPHFVLGETNKSTEFLKKFPLGKVPAFQTSDGKYLFESNAIAHYVGNEQLRGQTAVDQAEVVQWINFADHEILPPSCAWVFPSISIMQFNKRTVEQGREDVRTLLAILNSHLLTRTFLVGERITQADIALACTLFQLYEHVLDEPLRKEFGNVTRWFETLVNQPQFKAVVGNFKFCETPAKFDAQKFAALTGGKDKEPKEKKDQKGGGEKKDQKGGGEKKDQKGGGEKKDQKGGDGGGEKKKKEEAAEPAEEMDETEAILAAESKGTDPFAQFPKGTFVMDNFKKVYSNEDVKVSIPEFWNTFDKDNYSIWFCEYKYPEELTQVFMSCNLITGMFQRLDKMRKNAFASVILFGVDNASTISGVWIWRGHELAFQLQPDWQVDYESYSWRKLDPDVDDTKKLVNEYLSWSGDFGGKHFNQGKIFK